MIARMYQGLIRLLIGIAYTLLVVLITLLVQENSTGQRAGISSAPIAERRQPLANQGSIQVFFSPKGGATAAIIEAIGGAQNTILVAAYSFTSSDIAQALLAAKKRGLKIKIILDKSQMSQKYSAATFFSNQGFDLRIDVKHAIYHNKFMIIDEKTIITGSFNFTKAAEFKNAENLLIIKNNQNLAERYKDAWIHDWQQALSKEDYLKKKPPNHSHKNVNE